MSRGQSSVLDEVDEEIFEAILGFPDPAFPACRLDIRRKSAEPCFKQGCLAFSRTVQYLTKQLPRVKEVPCQENYRMHRAVRNATRYADTTTGTPYRLLLSEKKTTNLPVMKV